MGGDGRRVRAVGFNELKRSVTAHSALNWDERMSDLPGKEGIILQEDPSDNTAKVRFPPPVAVEAWLPMEALVDAD